MNTYFEVIHCSIWLPVSVDTVGIQTLMDIVCLTSVVHPDMLKVTKMWMS